MSMRVKLDKGFEAGVYCNNSSKQHSLPVRFLCSIFLGDQPLGLSAEFRCRTIGLPASAEVDYGERSLERLDELLPAIRRLVASAPTSWKPGTDLPGIWLVEVN